MAAKYSANRGYATSNDNSTTLPYFCQPINPELSKLEFQTASEAKAFTCLPTDLLDCVLQRFLNYVHPQIPVLNLDHLLRDFGNGNRAEKINLLLWQALATSTIPFLSESELSKAGLVSTEASYLLYLRRCKVLFEIRYEMCAATRLQAAMLLCHRAKTSREARVIQQGLWRDVIVPGSSSILRAPAGEKLDNIAISRALQQRLQWIYQLQRSQKRYCSAENDLHGFGNANPPEVLALKAFETNWIFSARAQTWIYGGEGWTRFIEHHVGLDSLFCQKTWLHRFLEGNKSPRRAQSSKKVSSSGDKSAFSVESVVATTLELEDAFEAYRIQRRIATCLERSTCPDQFSANANWLEYCLHFRFQMLAWLVTTQASGSCLSKNRSCAASKLYWSIVWRQLSDVCRTLELAICHGLALIILNINGDTVFSIGEIPVMLESAMHRAGAIPDREDLEDIYRQMNILYKLIHQFRRQLLDQPTMRMLSGPGTKIDRRRVEDDVSLRSPAFVSTPESSIEVSTPTDETFLPTPYCCFARPSKPGSSIDVEVSEEACQEMLLNLESLIYAPKLQA